MEKIAIFLLIGALASVLIAVDAACVERDIKDHNATETAVDKLSNFFMDVGCSIKSGAEKVKERVESGYNYLKSKIDDSDNRNKTSKEIHIESKPNKPIENKHDDEHKEPNEDDLLNDDRITFKDQDSEISPQDITTELPVNKTLVSIDDRTALTAPEMCPQDEVKVDGKCRKNVDL